MMVIIEHLCPEAVGYPAQVTNPPIDPLREGLVMSLNMRLGKRGNLLQPGPGSYNQLLLETPILSGV